MSKELAKTYDPKGIEERLYQKWMDNGYFHAKVNPDKKPFTIVMPPPNVTGQLHMGQGTGDGYVFIRGSTRGVVSGASGDSYSRSGDSCCHRTSVRATQISCAHDR